MAHPLTQPEAEAAQWAGALKVVEEIAKAHPSGRSYHGGDGVRWWAVGSGSGCASALMSKLSWW